MKALAVFRAYVQIWLHYRGNVVIWTCVSVVQSIVYLAVWGAVAGSSGGEVGGLDAGAFAAYFVVLVLVRNAVLAPIVYTVPAHVQSGGMSVHAVRPMHELSGFIASSLANKLMFTALGLASALALAPLVGARFASSAVDMAAAALLLPLAALTLHLVDSIFAMLAFWLVRIDGARGMYMLLELLAGGLVAPLALFPDSVRAVAEALPYWWALGYPAQLSANGQSSAGAHPLEAAGMLTLWCVVALVAIRLLWPLGMRRDQAVGL